MKEQSIRIRISEEEKDEFRRYCYRAKTDFSTEILSFIRSVRGAEVIEGGFEMPLTDFKTTPFAYLEQKLITAIGKAVISHITAKTDSQGGIASTNFKFKILRDEF